MGERDGRSGRPAAARRGAGSVAAVATVAAAVAALVAGGRPAALGAQLPAPEAAVVPAPHLPFFAGEQLAYQVRVARFGAVGRVGMTVGGPEVVRGTEVVVLRFDLRAGFGPLRAEDHTASWVDPLRLRALRYEKRERRPTGRHQERVELWPEQHRWERDGTRGTSTTDAPLDELSYLYFLRTLPLGRDTSWALDRHYDPTRNPTRVRVLGRRTVATEVGTFRTVTVEMRVRDAHRYQGGEGTIVVDLSDDACRLPVRIESDVPVFGRAVLLLVGNNHPTAHHLAVGR